MFYLKSDSSYE